MQSARHVRLFRNGRSQAIRIPKEFELEGNEAIIHKDGNRSFMSQGKPIKIVGHFLELTLIAAINHIDDAFYRFKFLSDQQ